MADSQKSIQVNIDVVVNQAKKAFADMATSTKKATESFSQIGDATKKSADVVDDSLKKAGKSSTGFFSSLQKDILSSLAAYDIFKIGIKTVGGFFQDSIKESMNAGAVMAQVRTNVENAGLSYKELGGKLDEYAKKQIQMGFDDEDTALSVSKLTNVTGSYTAGLKLNQIAMDLARSKNIDLATATTLVTQVTQGNGKVLKQYGIELSDTASAMDNLDKLQVKVGGSAAAFANTSAGKLEIVKNQWANIKQEVGDKLMPVLLKLFDSFEKHLPEIESLIKAAATVFIKMADYIGFVVTAAEEYVSVMKTGLTTEQVNANKVVADGVEQYQKLADAYNKTHQGAEITGKDLRDQKVGLTTLREAAHAYNEEQKQLAADTAKVEGEKIASLEKTKAAENAAAQAAEDHKQAMKDLSQAFVDVTLKQSDFSFKSVEDFDRFGKVLGDTKTKQDQWITSAKQGFTAFKAAIQSVDATITSLRDKISAANDSLQDFLTSTAKDSGNTFAQIVHDAEKSIPDLQRQIQDAQANGQDTSELQKQLAEKQAVIASSQQTQYTSNQAFVEQLAFLRSQDGRNELDQAYAVMNQKIDAKKKETEEAILEIQKQITAAEEQKAKFMLAQDAMTKAFGDNIKLRQKSSTAEIASLSALTSAVNAARDAYLALAAAMKKTGGAGASAGGSVGHNAEGTNNWRGGPTWVGERGPEIVNLPRGSQVIPNDKISAPNSGGMTININNPSVRNDGDIKAIADAVINVLNRRDELAKMGAYK